MKLFKRIKALVQAPERSLRERVFLVLTLCAFVVGLFALLGDILYGENIVEIIVLAITAILTPLVSYLGITRNRVELATRLITLGVICLLMPLIFFFGGGPEGGVVPWLVFSYLYVGLLLSGFWRKLSLLLLTVNVILMYLADYNHPEWIRGHDHKTFILDSALAVIEVGFVCFIMTWFQSLLLQEENRRAKEETQKYEELNRAQSRFFSSMSHEIRTPINSILGLNEIILRQEDASEEIIRDAGNIQGAGRMLLSLVNDILDISKIEAGKMDIVPVNYSVATMISELVNMMWLRAEEKGLTLKVEVDPFLPSELYGDEVRIRQILINLLNNAVKYTKEGSVTLHIELQETKGDRACLVFSVADTGMGIKQDALPYLFDAFQRVDEEKNRKIEGTGLGLSIVKQLVELMDGKIAVNSIYTQGSTFVVTLWQTVTNPKAIGSVNLTSYGSIGDGRKYEPGFTAPDARILIVDDNEMNLIVETKLLSGTKITIDTATSGAQAISMTLSNRYDMILMDHLMPEMDGIECMQRIRKQSGGLNNHVPVIALTANAGAENRELYSISGFDGYLVKPASGRQLEEMLLQHLPEVKVNRNANSELSRTMMNTAKGYSKKIPLLITTSTMCDLPARVLREHQLDQIPFTIRADGREYYDAVEVSTEELIRYMKGGMHLTSEPPTVEEFERFFGEELKKAHQVIHITVASGISKEYEQAKEAAKAYGDVFVFQSGSNSSSMGMLVLLAYQMARQGKTVGAILEELRGYRQRIQCSFVTEDAAVLMKRGFIGKGLYGVMHTLGIHPFVRIRDNTAGFGGITFGEHRHSYARYIDYALPRRANPDPELLMVPYVDMPYEDLLWLRERILKRFPFQHIVFQKASAAMSLNCGSGAFGLLYLEKGGTTNYHLGELLEKESGLLEQEEDGAPEAALFAAEEGLYGETTEETGASEEGVFAEESAGGTTDAAGGSPVDSAAISGVSASAAISDASAAGASGVGDPWYADIPNIDVDAAIRNSGSEEGFRMVMELFYHAIDEKTDELEGFYADSDWENYTIKVHALKSSARIVGAIQLAADAEALEHAGGAEDISYIKENHAALIAEFQAYKEPLKRAFDDDPLLGSVSPGSAGDDDYIIFDDE